MNRRNIARRNCQPRRRVLAWRCPAVYCTVTDMAAPAMGASPLPWWVPAGVNRGSQSIEQPLHIKSDGDALSVLGLPGPLPSGSPGAAPINGLRNKAITCVKPNDAVPNPRGMTPHIFPIDDLAFIPDPPADTTVKTLVAGGGHLPRLRPYQRQMVADLANRVTQNRLRGGAAIQPERQLSQAEVDQIMRDPTTLVALTRAALAGEDQVLIDGVAVPLVDGTGNDALSVIAGSDSEADGTGLLWCKGLTSMSLLRGHKERSGAVEHTLIHADFPAATVRPSEGPSDV